MTVAAATRSLPELIRDHVARALAGGAGPGTTVRITQDGEMIRAPGAAPRRFTAVETLATDRVAFAWRARFPVLGPLGFAVTDRYHDGAGRLDVRVLGLPLRRIAGADITQGEALRYLAEIAWVPQAALTNPELHWHEFDESTVEVSAHAGGTRVAVRLVFNAAGEIVQTVTRRPRLEAGGALTPWTGTFSDYRRVGGVLVPTRGEVAWQLPEGPFTYWRGTVTALTVTA